MTDALTTDDPRYRELFDLRIEAEQADAPIEGDLGPAFAKLRAAGPVQKGSIHNLLGLPKPTGRYSVDRETYTAVSFAACNQAFRDNETFSSRLYADMRSFQALGKTIIEMVGQEHRNYRATFQPMFIKPQAMTWWRQRWIDEIVASLIDNLRKDQRADLNLQFCARLPVHTVTRGTGMDGEEALPFREALLAMTGIKRATPLEQQQGAQTVERMLFELIAKRRSAPADDVISGMLAANVELADGSRRPLSDEEIMANCRMVMLAGGGTTWRQLGIALWALLTHPEQYEAVKADRSLVSAAIDESFRWNPTATVFSRLVTTDTMLDGVALPKGVALDICLGAANRDARRWEDPESFDIHRPFQMHLGFGIGPHQCIGMHVAKAEMLVAINALLDAFPQMRLDPDAEAPGLVGELELRGVSALPVLLA